MAKFSVTDEQLGILARRQNDLFQRVRAGELAAEVVISKTEDFIESNSGFIPVGFRRLIDCETRPWCPDNWKVAEHRMGGQIEFDQSKIRFYLDKAQMTGTIKGTDLRAKLTEKSVLNACVLDHLLANTNLIPESWKVDEKGRAHFIFFWGTIYCDASGNMSVRYLCWSGSFWNCNCLLLNRNFDDRNPAAILEEPVAT